MSGKQRFNKEQRKYLAGVLDKLSIAYFGVFGYTWASRGEWLLVGHALVVFALFHGFALMMLAEVEEAQK